MTDHAGNWEVVVLLPERVAARQQKTSNSASDDKDRASDKKGGRNGL